MQFANGSTLFVRAAYHSADSCRGISASLLMVNEFQDMAAPALSVDLPGVHLGDPPPDRPG